MRFLTTTALCAMIASPVFADWREDYSVVKFGVLSGENEKDRIARYTPLEKFLEKELGVEVEIFTAGNYDGVIQALAADQIEIARLGSSSYAAAYTATDGGVVPTLTDVKKDGTTGYYSIVVTRCDSGIKSLADAKGKIHAFADPDSTSGYAVPYYNMVNAEGFVPEEHFGTVTFGGSHEADVQGVYNGTFDTASTYQNNDVNGIYQRMENKGMIEKGQICKIWQSPEITTGPWTFRKNLPEDMIEEVTTAIEKFATADVEGFRMYASYDPADDNNKVGFQRVNAERYQWIVDMRAWIKKQRRSN